MKIIIVGAGASGLMAGKHLAAAGNQVQILEARDRIGGRIHTFYKDGICMEGGAEFIHGNLTTTLDALREAGIQKEAVKGDFWQCLQHEWKQSDQVFVNEALVEKRLQQLEEDISIAQFLEKEFSNEKYKDLCHSVLAYIEGYYAADPEKLSALRFYQEWKTEEEQQYRIAGGYGMLMQHFADSIEGNGGEIITKCHIQKVEWKKGSVSVSNEKGQNFTADKLIVTIPVGVWQNKKHKIEFSPAIQDKYDAADKLGFGNVIKILLQFKIPVWLNEPIQKRLKVDLSNLSFVISDETIPTYWTQNPNTTPYLTCWLAGSQAAEFCDKTDDEIVDAAIQSLSMIFHLERHILDDWLVWAKVFNWSADPYSCGGYSFSTIDSTKAKNQLSTPIDKTIYISGEGVYEGPETGTVEAALTSGIVVAHQVMVDTQHDGVA